MEFNSHVLSVCVTSFTQSVEKNLSQVRDWFRRRGTKEANLWGRGLSVGDRRTGQSRDPEKRNKFAPFHPPCPAVRLVSSCPTRKSVNRSRLKTGVPAGRNRPEVSVHARLSRLQALNRQQARIDRQ